MITRVCISINNRCNLKCRYCHFIEKEQSIEPAAMDIPLILDNIRSHIEKHNIKLFKIGFVGNGEPLLEYDLLKSCIERIDDLIRAGLVAAYTITNGTVFTRDMIAWLHDHKVNVGVSIDGIKEIHDRWRCHSHRKVMQGIELYREVTGSWPSLNCTVGQDVLDRVDETIEFFKAFDSRITFSRMTGRYGISIEQYREFLDRAAAVLNVRRGGYDCTMYGGKCAAGMDNVFIANGKIFICGNCVDIPTPFTSDTPLDQVHFNLPEFDRNYCYKESVLKR